MNNTASKPAADAVSASLVLFVVSCVQFITPMMASSVGIALPAIGKEFGASATQLSLIQLSYIFALAVLMIPLGRFADIHGRKLIFNLGIVMAIISTLAIGFVPNTEIFIFFRFLQGVSAAMINATSLAILTAVFPPERRGRALGIVAGFAYFGLAAGPSMAGTITTQLGWRWLFFLMVPLQMIVLILTLVRFKGEWADARGEKFGWSGSMVYIASLSLVIFGATQMNDISFAWLIAIAGLVGLGLFLKWEANKTNALFDVRLLVENKTFTLTNIATLINYGASFGVMFLIILYLQYVKGLSAQQAGLVIMITPCLQAIFSPIAGRWADIYSPRKVATIGMTICAVGLFGTLLMNETTHFATIVVIMSLLGVGFGIFASPNLKVVMGCVGPRHYGTAASISGTMRTGGILAGTVINTSVIALFMGDAPITGDNYLVYLKSMHVCMTTFAVMSVVGIGLSLFRVNLIGPEKH
ncbi:MFS transporter [Desulfosediminicola sp.]|uniref:MFS transporter n=1 Tax=Desulfosediminicola sp. TaxID=2886825 RepID=UPI003AF2A6E3